MKRLIEAKRGFDLRDGLGGCRRPREICRRVARQHAREQEGSENDAGQLRFVKLGRRTVIPASELERLVAEPQDAA